jgi:hypothetical protein
MIQILKNTSTEAVVGAIAQGGNIIQAGGVGVLLQQYGAGTPLTNSTVETSVFTTTKLAPQILGPISATSSTVSLPLIPGNFVALGTQIRGRIIGTLNNTGTPTIRLRVVLKNSAGSVVYTLADTTALTMSTITGTTEAKIDFDSIVTAVGTSGSVTSRIGLDYGTTATTASVFLRQAPAAVTVDTTASYTLDVLATWGAASSSNILVASIATIEVL